MDKRVRRNIMAVQLLCDTTISDKLGMIMSRWTILPRILKLGNERVYDDDQIPGNFTCEEPKAVAENASILFS